MRPNLPIDHRLQPQQSPSGNALYPPSLIKQSEQDLLLLNSYHKLHAAIHTKDHVVTIQAKRREDDRIWCAAWVYAIWTGKTQVIHELSKSNKGHNGSQESYKDNGRLAFL
jgi:hypothetical protein